MSGLFPKFEAIESRIASYSCPRGTTGRVHSLRLRRCFHSTNHRPQSIPQTNHQPLSDDPHSAIEGHTSRGDVSGHPSSLESKVTERGDLADDVSTNSRDRSRQRRIDAWNHGYDLNRSWIKRLGVRRLDAHGDVLPLAFPETATETDSSPDEAALYSALRVGNPHIVLKALANLIKHDGYRYTSNVLASVPATTFSEILRCLDPKHFLDRHAELHREIGPKTAQLLRLPGVDEAGYLQFCGVFLRQIHKIVEVRAIQYPLSTSDIKYLLKCARAAGSPESAQAIWHSMASISRRDPEKKIVPNAECYNHYLASKCWSDTFHPSRRYKLRVIPSNLRLRSWNVPPYSFQGHRVGPERGIKAQAAAIFREMVESGVSGNEETFCLMMVAMAREGDVSGISNILQRVWNIDVEGVLTKDESEVQRPKAFPPDSPFYPSEQILFTLAHVYGINNMIPNALRLVDYVSRQYNIDIPISAWNELLQWTFVLSNRRTVKSTPMNSADLKIGQLPPEAVSNLWNTMTSEPYNVKPTMEMYNRLITNLLHRHRYGEVKTRIEEAHRTNLKNIQELSRRVVSYRSTVAYSPAYLQRARDLHLAHLRVRRNRLYIRRWVRLWILRGSRTMRYDENFTTQDVPKFLDKWKSFLPVRVKYTVANGQLSFATSVNAVNFRMQREYANRANSVNLLAKRFILPGHVLNPGMLARRVRVFDGQIPLSKGSLSFGSRVGMV
jgi:hypothetical protein